MRCVNCERSVPIASGYRHGDGIECDDCHERRIAREVREAVNPRPTQRGVPVGRRIKNSNAKDET